MKTSETKGSIGPQDDPDLNPKISVIIPNYNKGPYLEQCLRSVLSQTHSNIEVIVCDDGSTDQSVPVIERLAAADPRLTLIRSSHRGKIAAINAAYSRVTGQYVKLFGSDDILYPIALERLLIGIADSKIAVHDCDVSVPNRRSPMISSMLGHRVHRLVHATAEEAIQSRMSLPSGLYLWDASFARIIFPLPHSLAYEDLYFFLVSKMRGASIVYVAEVLASYVQAHTSAWGGLRNHSRPTTRYRLRRDRNVLGHLSHRFPSYSRALAASHRRVTALLHGDIVKVAITSRSVPEAIRGLASRYFPVLHLAWGALHRTRNARVQNRLKT